MSKTKNGTLPLETEIEVFKIKGPEVRSRVMTYGEALRIKKTPGWRYINYQLGFCSLKDNFNPKN